MARQLAPDVRGVLVPTAAGQVLLPNACVSEVITYGTPQRIEDAPDWVLGRLNWRGWRMPVFSFAQMAGEVAVEETEGAKIAVLKAFTAVHRMPYIGMLASGFPKLSTMTADELAELGDQDGLPEGIVHRVEVNDDELEGEREALIPDLNYIEQHLLPLTPAQTEENAEAS